MLVKGATGNIRNQSISSHSSDSVARAFYRQYREGTEAHYQWELMLRKYLSYVISDMYKLQKKLLFTFSDPVLTLPTRPENKKSQSSKIQETLNLESENLKLSNQRILLQIEVLKKRYRNLDTEKKNIDLEAQVLQLELKTGNEQ